MSGRNDQLAVVRNTLTAQRNEIQRALPPGLSAERLSRIALTTIAKGHRSLLEACAKNKTSFYASVLESAQLGLTLNHLSVKGRSTPNTLSAFLKESLKPYKKGSMPTSQSSSV